MQTHMLLRLSTIASTKNPGRLSIGNHMHQGLIMASETMTGDQGIIRMTAIVGQGIERVRGSERGSRDSGITIFPLVNNLHAMITQGENHIQIGEDMALVVTQDITIQIADTQRHQDITQGDRLVLQPVSCHRRTSK